MDASRSLALPNHNVIWLLGIEEQPIRACRINKTHLMPHKFPQSIFARTPSRKSGTSQARAPSLQGTAGRTYSHLHHNAFIRASTHVSRFGSGFPKPRFSTTPQLAPGATRFPLTGAKEVKKIRRYCHRIRIARLCCGAGVLESRLSKAQLVGVDAVGSSAPNSHLGGCVGPDAASPAPSLLHLSTMLTISGKVRPP